MFGLGAVVGSGLCWRVLVVFESQKSLAFGWVGW